MTNFLAWPHHDPSSRYVSNPNPAVGETVQIRLALPPEWQGAELHLRTVVDGEVEFEAAKKQNNSEIGVFDLLCDQPIQHYRFHLRTEAGGFWLNGLGLLDWDPDDHNDFKLLPGLRAPEWVPESVWYQIFPDRFATSGRHRNVPEADEEWIQWAEWDDPIERVFPGSMTQMFGGDLDGVIDKLDHLKELGIGGVYLTPVFPGRSNHRYDAKTFDYVDPLLGGDAALLRLREACTAAGMRLMTDLTLNHTGDAHEWFVAAQADAASVEAGFYYFKHHPDSYESWFGVDSLPKLDHRSATLGPRLHEGPDSVVGRFIGPPFNLDGWRIDVANMTGRLGQLDINAEVARATRATFEEAGGDRWLVGEHFHDAGADTPGDGWHGVMNYSGISRPITAWLGKVGTLHGMGTGPGQDTRDGVGMMHSLDAVRASMVWSVMNASMSLLSSHDTARWRSICSSDEAAMVGVGMMMTLPGAPCFFYGDEIGLTGEDNEECRAPMPWGDEDLWDTRFLEWYRSLIHMRNEQVALHHGGFRWVHADADQVVWLRETADQRLLIRAARADGEAISLDPELMGASALTPLLGDHRDLTLPDNGPRFDVWAVTPSGGRSASTEPSPRALR